jgi:RimJ/RimL family protein N-acetyltransferase
VLTPISATDAGELQRICDMDGWDALQTPGAVNIFLTVDGCLRWFVWADSVARSWEDEDFPADEVHTCFAIRIRRQSDLAGVVGYTRLSAPEWHGRLTAYYWTAPGMRKHEVATDAVKLATPWALESWNVDEVFIHALNDKSEKVAKRAGFELTDESVAGHPVFRRRAS